MNENLPISSLNFIHDSKGDRCVSALVDLFFFLVGCIKLSINKVSDRHAVYRAPPDSLYGSFVTKE